MSGNALTVTAKWNWQKKALEIHPAFWEDLKVADGAEVTVIVTTDRNPAQLRFYWWFLGRIVESGWWEGDKDTLDDYTRMTVGFGRWRPIAAETEVLETAWEAAWTAFLNLTGLERLKKHFRKAIETYVAATPPRVVFIPDSISMSRCDGVKFNEYLRDAEKVWGERLGVDVEAIRRDAPPMDSGEPHAPDAEVLHGAPLVLGTSYESMQAKSDQRTSEPLAARLKRLADALHKDTPDLFNAAWASLKGTEEALWLYHSIPKQLKGVVDLNQGFADGRFNERDYQEILGKILEDASQ